MNPSLTEVPPVKENELLPTWNVKPEGIAPLNESANVGVPPTRERETIETS